MAVEEKELGKLKINSVESDYSIGKIIKGKGNITVGNHVKRGNKYEENYINLLLIISVFYCSNAFAKNITVTGVGITEAEATNDALRNAVETAVGVLVDSTTIVDKNMVLEDKIYAHSRGFINQYSIINKQKMTDAWKIMINAEVDLNPNSKLMNELTKYGLIDHILRNPKIAVIINEKNRRYYNQGSAAEIALT